MHPEENVEYIFQNMIMPEQESIIEADEEYRITLCQCPAYAVNEVLDGNAAVGWFLAECGPVYFFQYSVLGLHGRAGDEDRDDAVCLFFELCEYLLHGRRLPGAGRSIQDHILWACPEDCRTNASADLFRLLFPEPEHFRNVVVFEDHAVFEQRFFH